MERWLARRAHNAEVEGSNPSPVPRGRAGKKPQWRNPEFTAAAFANQWDRLETRRDGGR